MKSNKPVNRTKELRDGLLQDFNLKTTEDTRIIKYLPNGDYYNAIRPEFYAYLPDHCFLIMSPDGKIFTYAEHLEGAVMPETVNIMRFIQTLINNPDLYNLAIDAVNKQLLAENNALNQAEN